LIETNIFYRNLINQAYLLDKLHLARQIFALGYLATVESVIEKAVKLLMLDASTSTSKELCKLVVEQSFINLKDLVHFLEGDS
jgi:hypothetical protein